MMILFGKYARAFLFVCLASFSFTSYPANNNPLILAAQRETRNANISSLLLIGTMCGTALTLGKTYYDYIGLRRTIRGKRKTSASLKLKAELDEAKRTPLPELQLISRAEYIKENSYKWGAFEWIAAEIRHAEKIVAKPYLNPDTNKIETMPACNPDYFKRAFDRVDGFMNCAEDEHRLVEEASQHFPIVTPENIRSLEYQLKDAQEHEHDREESQTSEFWWSGNGNFFKITGWVALTGLLVIGPMAPKT